MWAGPSAAHGLFWNIGDAAGDSDGAAKVARRQGRGVAGPHRGWAPRPARRQRHQPLRQRSVRRRPAEEGPDPGRGRKPDAGGRLHAQPLDHVPHGQGPGPARFNTPRGQRAMRGRRRSNSTKGGVKAPPRRRRPVACGASLDEGPLFTFESLRLCSRSKQPLFADGPLFARCVDTARAGSSSRRAHERRARRPLAGTRATE